VCTSSRGAQGNGFSGGVSISADGRYVAFSSDSSTLVAGDTNGTFDVFVHDRQTGTTTRVSVGPGGRQAERGGGSAAISADGRYVAYYSSDPGLVSGDTNGQEDVFVRDQRTGAVERVSKSSRGVQSNGFSYNPAISADGRYVAFGSDASNLVPGDTNGAHDIFVHDRRTKATTRVSVGPGGRQANGQSLSPVISADGGVVAFTSQATNLVPGDTNGEGDVFVHLR
jgi:Tol biopolymer transport system component